MTSMVNAVVEILQDEKIVGVGTGRTVEQCIDAWPKHFLDKQYVVSSTRTRNYLIERGYEVIPLTSVTYLSIYVDGVDQIDAQGRALKGRGAAMTQEKLLAKHARHCVAVAQPEKVADVLDNALHPLPIEVLPDARSYVARAVMEAYPHAHIELRAGVKTDQGNDVLDLYQLATSDLQECDAWLKSLCGVVDHGLFALTRFDELWIDRGDSAERRKFNQAH